MASRRVGNRRRQHRERLAVTSTEFDHDPDGGLAMTQTPPEILHTELKVVGVNIAVEDLHGYASDKESS